SLRSHCTSCHRPSHSFPTRRSSDLSWIIPSAEHTINIAQMFYEMSLLAIPRKKIHPDVLSGESHSEMLDLLDQYSLTEDEGKELDRKSTRLNSSHVKISYAVFCLKK